MLISFTNLITSDVAKWLQTDSDFLVEVDEYQKTMELTESQILAEEKKRKELEAREISDKKQKASKHSPF